MLLLIISIPISAEPSAACTVLANVAVCLQKSVLCLTGTASSSQEYGLMTWHDCLFGEIQITAVPIAETCNCCAIQQRLIKYSYPRFANSKDGGRADIANGFVACMKCATIQHFTYTRREPQLRACMFQVST